MGRQGVTHRRDAVITPRENRHGKRPNRCCNGDLMLGRVGNVRQQFHPRTAYPGRRECGVEVCDVWVQCRGKVLNQQKDDVLQRPVQRRLMGYRAEA